MAAQVAESWLQLISQRERAELIRQHIDVSENYLELTKWRLRQGQANALDVNHLSLISLFGMVALAGVVVNDSLVLISAINDFRREGMTAMEAVAQGGRAPFRPIILTSLTTFFGLAPMTLETSVQGRFLIPMAISLGFGVLFVTVIALIIVPASYIIVEDIKALVERQAR